MSVSKDRKKVRIQTQWFIARLTRVSHYTQPLSPVAYGRFMLSFQTNIHTKALASASSTEYFTQILMNCKHSLDQLRGHNGWLVNEALDPSALMSSIRLGRPCSIWSIFSRSFFHNYCVIRTLQTLWMERQRLYSCEIRVHTRLGWKVRNLPCWINTSRENSALSVTHIDFPPPPPDYVTRYATKDAADEAGDDSESEDEMSSVGEYNSEDEEPAGQMEVWAQPIFDSDCLNSRDVMNRGL